MLKNPRRSVVCRAPFLAPVNIHACYPGEESRAEAGRLKEEARRKLCHNGGRERKGERIYGRSKVKKGGRPPTVSFTQMRVKRSVKGRLSLLV